MSELCWYDDHGRTDTKVCVVCQKRVTEVMDTMTRRLSCPCTVHKTRIFAICGKTEFLCDACQDEGWILLAGTGGVDALYNERLNLEIVRGQILAYDRVRSEETDDDDEKIIY